MTVELRFARKGPVAQAAVLTDGALTDYAAEDAGAPHRLGGIYRVKIAEALPAAHGAIAALGDTEIWIDFGAAKPPPRGATVTAQIEQAASRGKRARATLRPVLAGRSLAFDPAGKGPGLSHRIVGPARARLGSFLGRLAGEGGALIALHRAAEAPAEALRIEAAALGNVWRAARDRLAAPAGTEILAPRSVVEETLRRHVHADCRRILADSTRLLREIAAWLEYHAPEWTGELAESAGAAADRGLADALAEALQPEVALPSGARLWIEQTRALAAIDIDTAGASAGRAGRDRLHQEAARRIAREIRLRNLAGAIVIDLAGLGEASMPGLAAGVADDPMTVAIGTVSRLGLLEISRRRALPLLAEMPHGMAP